MYFYIYSEILRLGDVYKEGTPRISDIDCSEVEINSIEAIKVWGITFSYNEAVACKANITDKIIHYTSPSGI